MDPGGVTLGGAPQGALASRFRGFLPVVVDVETAGFDPDRHALLEVAVVTLRLEAGGRLACERTEFAHVQPFPGAELDPDALKFNRIDPYHPFRFALPEKEALEHVFRPVRRAIKAAGCNRAVLVGHNPSFDLAFVNRAVRRSGVKRNPFHPFTTFDTATLGGLAFGQTVLARAVQAAGLPWDEREAHSAIYDAERTAELFCTVVNLWDRRLGAPSLPR
jgi:ribonuclease T